MSTFESKGQSSFAVGESPPVPENGVSIEEIAEPKLHAHVRYAYIDENGDLKQYDTLRSVA